MHLAKKMVKWSLIKVVTELSKFHRFNMPIYHNGTYTKQPLKGFFKQLPFFCTINLAQPCPSLYSNDQPEQLHLCNLEHSVFKQCGICKSSYAFQYLLNTNIVASRACSFMRLAQPVIRVKSIAFFFVAFAAGWIILWLIPCSEGHEAPKPEKISYR